MRTKLAKKCAPRAQRPVREDRIPTGFSRTHEVDAIKRQLEALAVQAQALGLEAESHLIGVAALAMSDTLDL